MKKKNNFTGSLISLKKRFNGEEMNKNNFSRSLIDLKKRFKRKEMKNTTHISQSVTVE